MTLFQLSIRDFLHFKRDVLNLVYPDVCAGTQQLLLPNEKHISQYCFARLQRTAFFASPSTNALLDQLIQAPNIRMAAAMYHYNANSPLTKIIHKLKYNNRPEIGNILGQQLAHETITSELWNNVNCIVPIPLHPKRLRERGYNQSELIAQGISNVTGIRTDTTLLQRIRNNKSQTKMNREQRLKNTTGLFSARQNTHECVLLLDDIITTGATIVSAANALSISGVRDIRVCSIGVVT